MPDQTPTENPFTHPTRTFMLGIVAATGVGCLLLLAAMTNFFRGPTEWSTTLLGMVLGSALLCGKVVGNYLRRRRE